MRKKNIFKLVYPLFLLAHLVLWQQTLAQEIPLGTWRTHLTYGKANSVAFTPNRIYCATGGGLCFFDKMDNSIGVFTKIDGLSDTDITSIGYEASTKTLVIAYASGNIDLLDEQERIKNIRTVLSEPFLASRRINALSFIGKQAFLATDFGVVVLNLERQLVEDIYKNLSESGSEIAILGLAATSTRLYAATPKGLRHVALTAIKNDFRNWQTVPSTSAKRVECVAVLGSAIYFAQNDNNLYLLNDPSASPESINVDARLVNMTAASTKLILTSPSWVGVFDASSRSLTRFSESPISRPAQAVLDGTTLWLADQNNGFLSNREGNFKVYTPSGPFSAASFRLYNFGNKILALSGGINNLAEPSLINAGFYSFEQNKWQNFNASGQPPIIRTPQSRDLNQAAFMPDENKVYMASFGEGLLVWNIADNSFERLDSTTMLSGGLRFSTNRISGVCKDPQGNLWVACYGAKSGQNTYFKRDAGGTWRGVSFGGLGAAYPLELCADSRGQIWVRLSHFWGGGLLVISNDLSKTRLLLEGSENGELISDQVNCLHLDRDGNMLIGTEFGLNIFYEFSDVWSSSSKAELVFYENRALYREERISAITTDGGNRRWIASSDGLALFSADFIQKLADFNTQNSPLLSKSINGLTIEGRSGELFVATSQGMVSYRGTGTDATSTHSSLVKVFPNPVMPDFKGLIAIEGLAQNALFKVTDINGRLVFQGLAAGGTATWNALDYGGKRVSNGIYLVFCTNADGSDIIVTKIAVVE